MSNREELIAGAKKCLFELGYQRTTARDIVRESGVSLAAIGYHFGSKDALLNIALAESIAEWRDDLGNQLAVVAKAGGKLSLEETWANVISAIPERRGLWSVAYEMVGMQNRSEEIQRTVVELAEVSRAGIAAFHQTIVQDRDPEDAVVLAAFLQCLLTGVTIYHLVDPALAPTPAMLTRALNLLCAEVQKGSAGEPTIQPL